MPSAMTWKPTIVGLALALLLVGGGGWLSIVEVNHLIATWQARAQANTFIASATRLHALVAGDADATRHTKRDLDVLFAELHEQTSVSANQERRLKELEALLQRTSIQGGTGKGSKEAADTVRLLMNEMESEQRETLANLDHAATHDSKLIFLFVTAGTILSLTTIVAAGLLIYAQSKAARHADLTLTEFQRNTEAILSAAGQGVCHFDLNGKI